MHKAEASEDDADKHGGGLMIDVVSDDSASADVNVQRIDLESEDNSQVGSLQIKPIGAAA